MAEKLDRRVRKTKAQLRAGLARLDAEEEVSRKSQLKNWWMK